MPYTACKLVSFELIFNGLHRALLAHQSAARSLGSGQQQVTDVDQYRLALVLSSGLTAGALAAVVSQPFDLLLTRVCGSSEVGSLAGCVLPGAANGLRQQMAYLIGLGPAAFTGLAPRLAMISVMTSLQFVVYDSMRTALRCPPIKEKENATDGSGNAR